ncbi:MAG: hypothetical protein F6K54_17100 [Okeania sp. SIO3B5]|uniref:sulfotransferase domain-containing protein n=1 Tax=Okeania sp. SIO3B5 TaxID=2607811 RepID=UPI0013FE8F21|nr:sulfotransferase domain-containing protein [Okeania sp. SIO3B5]NEO54646.1 hypothetical protein [Okeania sp. SIO3B5]
MQETIWLIGNARSGTTWVMNLINHAKKYREMLEPFHPKRVQEMNFLQANYYIRSDSRHDSLEEISDEVFSGRFSHPRVNRGYQGDSTNQYQRLLIKDIFANLFSYWVYLRYPTIKIALLIRNPFSVALSVQKKKYWYWVTNPLELLHQPHLYEDYLEKFEDIIKKTSLENDYILCQILIWCIVNYVPLCQFKSKQLYVFFYEDIYYNPSDEISKLFSFINSENQEIKTNIEKEIVEEASCFAGPESNILSKTCPITSWKNELASKNIDAGFKILEQFGFENLYDENSQPNKAILTDICGI